jgi:nicotinate-nucleotide adenylyltransferase
MVRLAIEGESGFAFSDFDLARHGPTYTLDTVTHFAGAWGPGVALYWIIGADSFAELAGWHRVRDLVAACRILTAARPGFEDLEAPALRAAVGEAKFEELRDGILSTPRIDVSSTQIRERVRLGRSIRYLVPETVLRFIESHQLYRSPSPQRR